MARQFLKARAVYPGLEETNAAPGRHAEMVLDRGVDIAFARGGRKTPRQQVERFDLRLPPARGLPLFAKLGGELPGHDRDDHEHRYIDQFLRLMDMQAVDRRIEEEGGGHDTGNHRDKGGENAPARRGEDYGDHVAHADMIERHQFSNRKHDGGRGHDGDQGV